MYATENEAGMGEKELQIRMGHRSSAMTGKYKKPHLTATDVKWVTDDAGVFLKELEKEANAG